jgi:hypothetical protein
VAWCIKKPLAANGQPNRFVIIVDFSRLSGGIKKL